MTMGLATQKQLARKAAHKQTPKQAKAARERGKANMLKHVAAGDHLGDGEGKTTEGAARSKANMRALLATKGIRS